MLNHCTVTSPAFISNAIPRHPPAFLLTKLLSLKLHLHSHALKVTEKYAYSEYQLFKGAFMLFSGRWTRPKQGVLGTR